MLELLKFFLEKIDFLQIAEELRKRKNRRLAAQLHAILVQSYEILELYRVLLEELAVALKSYERCSDRGRFYINPARISHLLDRQASNLEVMETLTYNLMDQLRTLDNRFLEAYRELFPGKFGLLFAAQSLLAGGRLPLVESGPERFPADVRGEYRTLWFPSSAPIGDRREIEQYLYGWDGRNKKVVDVSTHDGDVFFRELSLYFESENPIARLDELDRLTESYRDVLLRHFSIEDLLAEIGKVKRHGGAS